MNRNVSGKEGLIIGAFVLILIAGSYGYIRWATAPSRPASREVERPKETGSLVRLSSERLTLPARETVSEIKLDYDDIVARNIFEKPAEKTQDGGDSQAQPAPSTPSPPPMFPTPMMPFTPPMPPPAPPAQKPTNLTATGVMSIGEEKYALLENTQTRETALVKVGESALGVQVASIGEGYVEVRQGSNTFRIALGEGKQERRVQVAAAPQPAAPPPATPPQGPSQGQPGFGGGFGEGRRWGSGWATRALERWNQMPDFVRQRIRDRLRETWDQLPESTRQEIQQRAAQMGINIAPSQ
ncbi:MAG: hypothetical protein NZ959_02190 [Armatimonadetes bacterium]|nr:hypothetical protein [Armatimonadota bacterium]MDW8121016.1 hypothetical protein [Armatimonadota bacterium]